MSKKLIDEVCRGAISHFGIASQMNKSMEELAECIAATSRLMGHSTNSPPDDISELVDCFVDEVADALIVTNQLSLMCEKLDEGALEKRLLEKILYLADLLPEEHRPEELVS